MPKITMTSIIEDFGRYFSGYGITASNLKEVYDGKESLPDFIWAVFQNILIEVAKALSKGEISLQEFYKKTGDTYKQMAYLLQQEKKDSRRIQTLQFENEIKYAELAYRDLIGFKIFSFGCCDFCHPYHNKIMNVQEALEFAKTTDTMCESKYHKHCRKLFFIEEIEDENSPIKISFSVE